MPSELDLPGQLPKGFRLPSAGKVLGGVALPAGAAAISQDPVDVATAFAKARNMLPIGLAMYSPELNAGEAEWIAARRAERDMREAQMAAQREPTVQEVRRDFERRFPTRFEQQLMLEYMRRQAEREKLETTRPQPEVTARHEARAIEPRRKAAGGSVKQEPVIVNGPTEQEWKEFGEAVSRKYAKGGAVGTAKGVAKALKELDKPDLTRRMIIGMKPDLPVAKLSSAMAGVDALTDIEKAARKTGDAPKVTEKTVQVDPGRGKKEVTVKSLTETPVSRREVLQTVASQAARRVLPTVGQMPVGPQEMFAGASDWPSVYRAMLPMVMKHAPQELETLPSRVGVKLEDLLRVSEEDPFVRSMSENLTRFQELFPLTFKKAIGGIGEGAAKRVDEPVAGLTPRVVYHAGADFETPNPGLFTTPDLEAAEKFLRNVGGSKLHTFHAQPKQSGTDKDVAEAAKLLGIYDPKVPVGQYLEQGENAIFAEAPALVRKLREKGLDSVVINDGMSSAPSLVVLDPAVLTRAPERKPKGKAAGGAVDGSDVDRMISEAVQNGMSESQAIRAYAPIFAK
ncbi:MAG: hypothetical protein RIS70_2367 [Planctomycetota bacterium]|jgi:hypothetical protein